MPLDFPSSPILNQTYTFENKTWKYNGTAWVSISVTPIQGIQGIQGSSIQGIQGTQGTDGAGVANRYLFSTDTTATDPGAGYFKLNNATVSNVTTLYISNTDSLANSRSTWIESWDDSSSSVKGIIYATAVAGGILAYNITGTITSNAGWYSIPVSYLTGGVGTNNAVRYITFSRTGDIGIQGIQGVIGTQGIQGFQGIQGIQGIAGLGTQGIQGITGRDGNFGGASFDYTFDSSTTASDPGVGKLRFNNSVLASATALYIDNANDASTDLSTFLNTIDDSTSTIKGHYRISKKFDDSVFALFTISSLTNNTGWFTVNSSYVSGNGSFTNLDDIVITFARTGDKGDTGATGTQGVQGIQGIPGTGAQGIQGIQGTKPAYNVAGTPPTATAVGETWYDTESGKTFIWYDSYWVETSDGIAGVQGISGIQGANGNPGMQGVQGIQGPSGSTTVTPSDITGGSSGQAIVSNGTNGSWTTLSLENLPDAAFKKSVIAATTGSNITLSGGAPNTLDGISLSLNDRILVKDQTNLSQNGIYYVSTLGTGSNGTWTRTLDGNTASEIAGGTVVVDQGTGNGGLMFRTTFESTDTLGTTAMYWYPIANTGFYTLAANRSISSNTNAQSIFGVAFTVSASTTYIFEGMVILNTGTTSHHVSFNMAAGGSASLTNSFVTASFIDNPSFSGTTASVTQRASWSNNVTTAFYLTNGTSTQNQKSFYVKGLIRVNAGGTLTPQITFSAAPGGTNTVGTGSWFTFTPYGHASVTSIGPWA